MFADGRPLDLAGRYFDALLLLVRERGRLVRKERFMAEVWHGAAVTDEALTQCIRSLRRLLGDDASAPRFIETVPRHGYRFIAPVAVVNVSAATTPTPVAPAQRHWGEVGAGALAGGVAGALGGLCYGFAAAASARAALSTVLVVSSVSALIGLLAAAGVAGGIALARARSGDGPFASIAGGAAGGLLIGGLVKLIALDAFALLIGRAPLAIAGPFEGVLLGAGVGLAAWLVARGTASRGRAALLAAAVGASAGALITLLGGRLMAGSLVALAYSYPGSQFRLGAIGALLGEGGFGVRSRFVSAMSEGALFAAAISLAMARPTPRA